MQARLDQLNHLVARTEPQPGRFVSFYQADDGSVVVSESGPRDGKQLLAAADVQGVSIVDLYRRLAKAEPPIALVQAAEKTVAQDPVTLGELEQASPLSGAPATAPDGITTVKSGLTEADGPWYLQNGCYGSGEFGGQYTGCRANQTGEIAWAEANAKTSFFNVAIVRLSSATVRLKISDQHQVHRHGRAGRVEALLGLQLQVHRLLDADPAVQPEGAHLGDHQYRR